MRNRILSLALLFFFTLMLFTKLNCLAQIHSRSTNNSAIIITPNGLSSGLNTNLTTENVVFGSNSLNPSTTGTGHLAIGIGTLRSNTTGNWNTAIGNYALEDNTTGFNNVSVGYASLAANTTGFINVAMGNSSLNNNSSGVGNCAYGANSLESNTTGRYNIGTGVAAIWQITSGNYNIGIGHLSGSLIVSGSNNTFLGYKADATADFINSMALGANTKVNASNKIRVGDANITVIEGQVAWSNPSDRKLKENIIYTDRLGLNFINNLQTASYNYSADKNKTRYDGFIAQDIEKTMQELGVPFSGLKKSEDGFYSLAYSDFVIPLVNSVKELKKQNDELLNMLQKLILEVNNLKSNNTDNNDETSKK